MKFMLSLSFFGPKSGVCAGCFPVGFDCDKAVFREDAFFKSVIEESMKGLVGVPTVEFVDDAGPENSMRCFADEGGCDDFVFHGFIVIVHDFHAIRINPCAKVKQDVLKLWEVFELKFFHVGAVDGFKGNMKLGRFGGHGAQHSFSWAILTTPAGGTSQMASMRAMAP